MSRRTQPLYWLPAKGRTIMDGMPKRCWVVIGDEEDSVGSRLLQNPQPRPVGEVGVRIELATPVRLLVMQRMVGDIAREERDLSTVRDQHTPVAGRMAGCREKSDAGRNLDLTIRQLELPRRGEDREVSPYCGNRFELLRLRPMAEFRRRHPVPRIWERRPAAVLVFDRCPANMVGMGVTNDDISDILRPDPGRGEFQQ